MLLSLDRLSLLIVESNPLERALTSFLFEAEGAEVISVASSTEATEAIKRFRPEVLISELILPKNDGYVLIDWLRKHPSRQIAQIPAIALTTAVTEKDREQALQAGFQHHVSKPAKIEDLVATVAYLCHR